MNDVCNHEDTISLYDLWAIFLRREVVFWTVLILTVFVGGIFVISNPHTYSFTKYIGIASYSDGTKSTTVIPLDYLNRKIYDVYLPESVNQYNSKHLKKIKIDAEKLHVNNVGDRYVAFRIDGALKEMPIYTEVFQSLLAYLQVDTDFLLQKRLDYINGYLKVLISERDRQVNSVQSLNDVFFGRQGIVGTYNAAQDQAVSHGMSEMMMQRLFVSEGYVDLIVNLDKQIAELQYQKNSLVPTSSDSGMVRSSAVGPSRLSSLVLVAILGIILGFFSVFVAEFFSRFRNRDY